MKTTVVLLGIGTSSVLAWSLLAIPSVSTAQRLGAASAAIETPYKTEHAWALREISADINEIARYRGKQPAAPAFAESIVPWRPELLTAYAASQLAFGGEVKGNENDPADQYDKLLPMSVDAIIKSNATVSASLKRDMRNPRAHEAAAMLLGAFGLRESAAGMSDTRWALNRMTAHLAVAQALRRGQSTPSIDGQLASATLSALLTRQKTALAALDAMTPATPAHAAWQRALRMRVTQDWRILTRPATASRLEKLEYFRARRHTLRQTRGGQDVSDLREPIAVDFGRIAQARPLGVEDGDDFILEGLANEIHELAYVYRQLHQKELPEELPANIVNVRAGRLLAGGDPQVLPWGAWAEFAQRHIGMSIEKVDYHYRHMLVSVDRADQLKRTLDQHLGHLTLYPVASTGRTKGQRGTEADLSQISRAIDVAVKSPELVSYDFWSFIENGSKYEPVARAMPQKATWFVPMSAEMPYDAGLRADGMLGYLKPPAVEALIDEAPHNIALLSRVLLRFKTIRPLTTKVRLVVEPRVDYDMWAIDSAIDAARDPDDRIALRRKACALAVSQCIQLADEIAGKDEAAAAAEYEKAYRDPSLDQVLMTHSSGWLVSYYERTGQLVKAMDLAQRSSAVGSASGMLTLGRLYERRLRLQDADGLFTATANRYPQRKPELAGFLYRQAVTARRPEFLDRWKAIERQVFPNGLQPVASAMPAKPSNGVFVEKDSYWSRQVRLQAGDIIVGLDGWKVDDFEQYQTIVQFLPPDAVHKFTAWRGVLFTVDLHANNGMTLKTYPLKGWIE